MKSKIEKKTKKIKTELLLELDGKVFIIEKKNGKEILREEIDGKTVLRCLLSMIEQAVSREIK